MGKGFWQQQQKRTSEIPITIYIYLDQRGGFIAHKLVKVLACGFKTSFQTSSGFKTVYSSCENVAVSDFLKF